MTLPRITAFDGPEHRAFTLNGEGDGAALLIHGFPGTPDEMRPLAEALHADGWTVHAVLLPGFGPGINEMLDYGYADWLAACQAGYAPLARDHARVIVVGHSMGGALAIALAAQTNPAALIALAPFYTLNHPLWTALPALRRVMPQIKPFKLMKPDFNNPEMRAGILNFMPGLDLDDPATQRAVTEFALPLKLFDHIREAGQRAYRAAPGVSAPALIVQGARDDLVKPANTRRLAELLKGGVTWVEVDAEHDLIRADRPAWQQVAATVRQFALAHRTTPTSTTVQGARA
jgi:carboxylesterase